MKYTTLGRAGATVSRLALGTMNFGWHTDEETSNHLMDAALEAGVNFFDTADIYGAGTSESIIGRWLAADASRRDQVVLATKAYIGFDDKPNAGGLSALHLRKACEDSLRRLQTDHIDLYQFHHVDRSVRWEEILEATERLVRDGKVTYVGTSNFAGWDITLANEKADARGMLGFVTEQSVYNLMERTIELEVIPAAGHYGMGILPWSPLAGGLLAGKGSGSGRRGDGSDLLGHDARSQKIATLRESIPAFESLAQELDATPANLALAWLLAQPQVTAPVLGPRTVSHFTDALAALDVELDASQLAKLDELFPGPGGAAPDAYTWS